MPKKTFDITLNVDELRKAQEHFIQGKKGTYLDLKVIEMDNKEYNDFVVVVKIKRELYDTGKRGAIVGYGKDWSTRGSGGDSAPAQPSAPKADDDLPF